MADTDGIYWKPVRPADCALLVAIPLTRDAFLADVTAAKTVVASQARGDYADQMVAARLDGDAEAAWRADGRPVARLCCDLLETAEATGFRFVRHTADRQAFQDVLRAGTEVLMVVAHRRGADVLTSDLRPGVADQLRACARRPDDRLAQLLAGVDYDAPGAVRRALNAFISGAPDPDDARDEIDRLLADRLVPGSCLELRDGYYKDAAIAGWVPPDWAGIVELGACHSMRLAGCVKRDRRQDRHVITNECLKEPARCLREMREMALQPAPYVPLRADVFKIYSAMIRGQRA